jgi:YesN/AraC family two-component response regulator
LRDYHPDGVPPVLTLEGIHQKIDDYILKPTDTDKLIALVVGKLAERKPKARILSVSYDQPLMRTRQMLLETKGYEVVSAIGFANAPTADSTCLYWVTQFRTRNSGNW